MNSHKGRTLVVGKVSAPKPYDLLAEQLREAILRGDISDGEALPPERELVEQTGLTRGSVREALRVLAVEGLVETKPGRSGGNIVRLPASDSMTASIAQFVRGRRLPISSLNETREAIEPLLARLAALRRTDEDVRVLTALHEELVGAVDDFPRFSSLNFRWHNAIGRASGNELLAGVLHAISYGVAVTTTTEEYDTPKTRAQVIAIHERINAAIAAGDAEAAERRMRHHIGATRAHSQVPESTNILIPDD